MLVDRISIELPQPVRTGWYAPTTPRREALGLCEFEDSGAGLDRPNMPAAGGCRWVDMGGGRGFITQSRMVLP